MQDIQKYVASAVKTHRDEENNIITFLDKNTGTFKAFYPKKDRMVEFVKEKDRLVGYMYSLGGDKDISDEDLRKCPTEDMKGIEIAEIKNQKLDNKQTLDAVVSFDSRNVVRSVMENSYTQDFFKNICNIDTKQLDELLMGEEVKYFKAEKVNQKHFDTISRINTRMQMDIGDKYKVSLSETDNGTYIRATSKNSTKDIFMTFKENGEVDKYSVKSDDGKVRAIVRDNNIVIREAPSKDSEFVEVIESFRKA